MCCFKLTLTSPFIAQLTGFAEVTLLARTESTHVNATRRGSHSLSLAATPPRGDLSRSRECSSSGTLHTAGAHGCLKHQGLISAPSEVLRLTVG